MQHLCPKSPSRLVAEKSYHSQDVYMRVLTHAEVCLTLAHTHSMCFLQCFKDTHDPFQYPLMSRIS